MEVFVIKVLVTGGLGYIGSHTCVELLNASYEVVVVDNLYNSSMDVLDKIKKITGKDLTFYEADVCNEDELDKIFRKEKIDAVIHFAAYKAVGESVKFPIMYYENNLSSTLSVCKVMLKYGCRNFIFSSSATVYGVPKSLPIKEDFPLSATNPYGNTKLINEKILEDICVSNSDFSVVLLRYFNPIGAHKSGLIGENPKGIPNNLMPYIMRVAARGQLGLSSEASSYDKLYVFGGDYHTLDGTAIRDYIHVVDLARGHIKALLKAVSTHGIHTYNLGTGVGYSVLDLVKTYEKVNGVKVPYEIVERRAGDIEASYADVHKAEIELGFKAEYGIEDMCRDSYLYFSKNEDKSTDVEI